MQGTPPFVRKQFDPLDYLLNGLEVRAYPPPEWVQQWTNNPFPDPLQSAWKASTDPRAMVQILVRNGNHFHAYLYFLAIKALKDLKATTGFYAPTDASMAEAIQKAIPQDLVPKLADIRPGADA